MLDHKTEPVLSPEERKAIQLVKAARVEREPDDITVKSKLAAYGGTIYFVHLKSKKENREMDSLSFFPAGSDEPVFLWGGEEATRYFASLKPLGVPEAIARHVFSPNGVSAIIALMITVTICYLVIGTSVKIPEILANALTTIIGFFFGSAVGKTKS